ncbi:MAG TPA: C4-dicarboxylate ABC transporter [Methyloceanibacter sp.]|nr:C4-dicarboxylate ABC transporter [Methyloceanibacter sp.]
MRRRLLLVATLLATPSLAAGVEPVRLVTPVVYGTHLPGLGEPAARLATLIDQRSSGGLILELKEPGDGTKPDEILDKVSDGKVDAGFATASFWAAKLPAASLFAGYPFGLDAPRYLAWFDSGSGRTLYQEMYDHAGFKVHVVPCAFGGAEAGGWFAKEIKTTSDLEGLRMRIFGLGGRVMSRAGAVTVLMPGGDLDTAFTKKKIDAAELYTPAVDEHLGIKDKVKLIYQPGWQQPETVLELLINKNRWDALSEADRALIAGACRDTLRETLADSARLQTEALDRMKSKDGVRIEQLPEAVLSTLRSAWDEVAKEEGDRDYFFRTVLQDIAKFGEAAPNKSVPAPAQGSGAAAETKPTP